MDPFDPKKAALSVLLFVLIYNALLFVAARIERSRKGSEETRKTDVS
jgi:hypothetical protein